MEEKKVEVQEVEPWMIERVQEIMIAQGKLFNFGVEDIPQDELREKFEIAEHGKRMRNAAFSMSHERCSSIVMPDHDRRNMSWWENSEIMKGGKA